MSHYNAASSERRRDPGKKTSMEDISTVYSVEAVNALKKPPTGHSAEDVTNARNRWLDARTAAQQVEADLSNVSLQYSRMASHGRVIQVEKLSLELANAREEAQLAEEHFQEVLKEAGHLAAAASNQAQLDQMKKDEEAAALVRAEEAMKAYRASIEGPYIMNGGTPEMFESAFPGLWKKEVTRRTLEGRDLYLEKMQGTGRYPPI